VRIAPVVVLAVASSVAAGPATERDRLQCLGTIRRDLGRCITAARERCEIEYRRGLPDCLGGAACPDGCVTSFDACQEPQVVDRDGCRLACQSDLKVAIRGCRLAKEPPACRSLARTKAIECKGRCTRGAAAPLRACNAAFTECLRACARVE